MTGQEAVVEYFMTLLKYSLRDSENVWKTVVLMVIEADIRKGDVSSIKQTSLNRATFEPCYEIHIYWHLRLSQKWKCQYWPSELQSRVDLH
jgi:hypothetical protein